MTTTPSVKMLREHLCREQRQPMTRVESALHGYLIALCDVLRPLGPDGKHGGRHTALCGCDDIEPSMPATTTFASGGVITEDQVRQIDAPVLDAINRPAATTGLGDALRQAAEVDPPTLYAALPDLAAQADALESERVAAWDEGYGAADKVTSVMISTVRQVEAERDRLADERDTLRTALDQERRSMANRLAVLERIKGERDVAWAAVGRVRAALARWTGTPGAYTDHGSALARAWKSAAIDIEAALDGDESQPCDSGAGAEGSRTRETGAWTDEQGGSGMSGGSGAAGASEGENGGCVFAMRGRRG